MAYTRVWVNNTPPGAQAANTADDEIRNLRVDVEERMGTLVTGWLTGGATDPIVVKPEILGNVTGKKLTLHWSEFVKQWDLSSTNAGAFDDKFVQGPVNTVYVCPIPIPVGDSITSATCMVGWAGGTIIFSLHRGSYSAVPTDSLVGSVNIVSGGDQVSPNISGLPHTVLADNAYYLSLSTGANAGNKLYGAQIIYNTPDCRNTI